MEERDIRFQADAALLRELGARLVGKPHIALAELIKNAYDADARHVDIYFEPDRIVVEDDGHGMSPEAFESRWMRIGTTEKARQRTSPELGRPLTGSKGVGRLAAQLLAGTLELESAGLTDPGLGGHEARHGAVDSQLAPTVEASIVWDTAVAATENNDLTEVVVPVVFGGPTRTFARGSRTGTRLILTDLADTWEEDQFRNLAREIWALQPPFEVADDDELSFEVRLHSGFGEVVEEFSNQMKALFDLWQGHITMALVEDDPAKEVLFEFDALKDYDDEEDQGSGDDAYPDSSSAASHRARRRNIGVTKLVRVEIELRKPTELKRIQFIRIPSCPIDQMTADFRIFDLRNRQDRGVKVQPAREYMKTFGGMHIYDGSFRLPYYGPEDWLDLERDHARRLSRSQLLPENLRVAKGMHDLPSRRRLFGTTRISTAHEQETSSSRNQQDTEALAIQVTRDRLTNNQSYVGLKNIVRLGLDLYATEVARAKGTSDPTTRRRTATPPPKPSEDLEDAQTVLDEVRPQISTVQYESLKDSLSSARSRVENIESSADAQAALLGSLATIGMTTLAWEHEAAKQRLVVVDAAEALRASVRGNREKLEQVVYREADRLDEAAHRMNDVARLFRPVLDRESRETRVSMNARRLLLRTTKQLNVLSRGAEVDAQGVPRDLQLPPGTFAAWAAIFQNVLVNAFNAVLEQPKRVVRVDGGDDGQQAYIRVQDTGVGVDLAVAESYFQPFARGMSDDPRRAELGLGGSGLGLTIVRMIGDTIGVAVRFTEPDESFSTAVTISWPVGTRRRK